MAFELHIIIFGICVAIGIVVFSIMFYALIKQRNSLKIKTVQFHGNALLEIVWSVLPFVIIVVMAIPAMMVVLHS